MDRRHFLRLAAASGGLAATGGASFLAACAETGTAARGPVQAPPGTLYLPREVSPDGLTLTARAASAEVAPGVSSPILTWGDGPVGPAIRARTGERARILMRNELPDPTIAHWHGLRPPQESDGHPRFAVGTGGTYRYDFEVSDRAALYWYHPHPHMDTGRQSYYGLVGLFLVRDEVEDALGLPDGDREIPLVLQDKRQDASGRIRFDVVGHDAMEGFLGDAAFVNGVLSPRVEVESGLYRLRVLNGSTSRIFRVALSSGAPVVLIGTDGGLLEAPVELPFVDMGVGERADLLVDLSGVPVGTSVTLKSLPFTPPSGGTGGMGRGMGGMGGRMGRGMGGMGGMGGMAAGGLPQGAEMDLLEFAVARGVREDRRIPTSLVRIPRLSLADAERERVFRFESMMMSHTINGRSFSMNRVDERVPFGATETWTFVNDSPLPHPVHMHAVHFQVVERAGGRGRVLPWEQGWKDTVLVHPGERVQVVARFETHRGLFLLHCHNMVHEDAGMMLNFLIE